MSVFCICSLYTPHGHDLFGCVKNAVMQHYQKSNSSLTQYALNGKHFIVKWYLQQPSSCVSNIFFIYFINKWPLQKPDFWHAHILSKNMLMKLARLEQYEHLLHTSEVGNNLEINHSLPETAVLDMHTFRR